LLRRNPKLRASGPPEIRLLADPQGVGEATGLPRSPRLPPPFGDLEPHDPPGPYSPPDPHHPPAYIPLADRFPVHFRLADTGGAPQGRPRTAVFGEVFWADLSE